MSARFEIVRTEDGYFARFVAANNRIVWVTPGLLSRREAAKKAIETVAKSFTLTAPRWTYMGDQLRIYVQGVGADVCEVDERQGVTS